MISNATRRLWRQADAVCFDVDSTVTREEAIDSLAAFCGKRKEVEEITNEAMGGSMNFREALRKRLNIIKPTTKVIQEFLGRFPASLSPGVKSLISKLHNRGTHVYLISGGFQCLIEPVATELGIPLANVFCNQLLFYYHGEYAGFDESLPTSRNHGKATVVGDLKEKHDYQRIVMIGDGSTDWEACPPADAFIGYGGNVFRETIQKRSKWYVTDFQELIDSLDDPSPCPEKDMQIKTQGAPQEETEQKK